MELIRLGLRRTGHSAQFCVHTEIVLDRDRRQRLGFPLDFDAFLGLHGLVQSIAPPSSGKDTAGVFINDQDLVVLNHVLDVLFIETEGLDKLVHIMDALAAQGDPILELLFLLGPLGLA